MSYEKGRLAPASSSSAQPSLDWIRQTLCLLLVLTGVYGLSPVLRAQVT
jgi:hypothetical protein